MADARVDSYFFFAGADSLLLLTDWMQGVYQNVIFKFSDWLIETILLHHNNLQAAVACKHLKPKYVNKDQKTPALGLYFYNSLPVP